MEKTMECKANKVREFNRYYTDIIGLVNQTILKSPYSLAEARVMLEMGKAGACTATDLTKLINIDPGYLSRMLKRFIREQLVVKKKSLKDGRTHLLQLTDKGRDTSSKLSEESTQQIMDLLDGLPTLAQERLIQHMEAIRTILSKRNNNEDITIRNWQPGDLGYIAHRHGVLYTAEYQLAPIFESYVLEGLLKFVRNGEKGKIWIAECNGQIAGFIAIVGIDESKAQLRWFLIEPEFRGIGLGRRLVDQAMDYCRSQNYKHVLLWTFQGLDAACHLYAKQGFTMTEQVPNDTWRKGIIEERWDWSSD